MKIKNLIVAAGLVFTVGAVALVPTTTTLAATIAATNSKEAAKNGVIDVGGDNKDNGSALTGTISALVNTALFIVGVISVVMIIYAGIRYQTAAGDPAKIKTAQHTLTYAIVGLIIAILAYAIVNFVIGQL
ncbi:pilin [Candidatus Saccharibacteria bacterium]|nr:pilin [Candidatus Saccharibacteria bacterium]